MHKTTFIFPYLVFARSEYDKQREPHLDTMIRFIMLCLQRHLVSGVVGAYMTLVPSHVTMAFIGVTESAWRHLAMGIQLKLVPAVHTTVLVGISFID